MPATPIESVYFPNGHTAQLTRVAADTLAAPLLKTLCLPPPRALLILNGGTAKLEASLADQLASALQDGLARVVAEEQITVITGGTDAGIFQLFGQGLARYGRTAPCIGVSVADLVSWPGHPQGEAPLEPHHSHFVLVEGKSWGDETQMMYALIRTLAQTCPSITVFAGGGQITIHEMQMNVQQERSMIFLAGSGRATDAVLAARQGELQEDARLVEIAQQAKLCPVAIREPPAVLAERVRKLLALA